MISDIVLGILIIPLKVTQDLSVCLSSLFSQSYRIDTALFLDDVSPWFYVGFFISLKSSLFKNQKKWFDSSLYIAFKMKELNS